jgi:ubiquinone/menaquinone biosynthesis C-methylase UbiE
MPTSQDRVRDWWNRNPMSYDVDDPIPYEWGTKEYFRELDSRVFHPRVLRLTTRNGGRPFSYYVDFESLRGKDVLDVGFGSGFSVQLFAEAGANVTGVDLTPWAVDTTRARLEAFDLEADVDEGDAEQLPFPAEAFDFVFAWGVIHHSSNMDQALAELVRVCRRGGTVVIMVYNRHSLFYVFYRLFQRFLPLARRVGLHFEGARAGETEGLIARHFTPSQLRSTLSAAGLGHVRIVPYGQDAELLPLPRRVRVPITDRLPVQLKDRLLRRWGHQLGASGIRQR